MNRQEIIKHICWELANYKMGEVRKTTEQTAEYILNLCAEYYGYLPKENKK